MMKTLITGASGFIGQNLLSYLLSEGMEVSSLSLRSQDWALQMPQDYHAVVHLAGKAHDTSNTSAPQEYFTVNTELTRQLFDHFLQCNTARDFIYFSSVKAVADIVNGILTETTHPAPTTPYGQSKRQAEQYLMDCTLPEGKRLFILRPCMVHGPGNKGNLNLLYKMVSRGIPWPLAAFENRRSFFSITNLQFIIQKILKSPKIIGGIYHLADDEALSTNELIELIGEVRGKKARLWNVSVLLMESIAQIGDRFRLPLNTERLKKLTENYMVDNTKIKQAIGIKKLPVSAREGLIATLRSFQK